MGQSRLPRIAVIDDDPDVRMLLTASLEGDGFDVRVAGNGIDGVALVRSWVPDGIVLDLIMPQMDGLTAIPIIRRFSHAPIVIVSARGDLHDRLAGFEAGADDYLTKPVALSELSARLRSALRRPQLDRSEILRFADLELDLALRVARRGHRRIALSTREFALLATLMRRPRRVFTRDELIVAAWDAGRTVTHNTVETYVSYLRAKVDRPPERRLIVTVRGIGYALAPDG